LQCKGLTSVAVPATAKQLAITPDYDPCLQHAGAGPIFALKEMIKEIRGGGKTNIECRISNVEGKRPFDAMRLLRAASPFSTAIRTPKTGFGDK